MRIFLLLYGVVVVVVATVLVRDPGFVGNVGFLIFGALLGIYPVFIIDDINRSRASRNVAKALFQELAKLVAAPPRADTRARSLFQRTSPFWEHYGRIVVQVSDPSGKAAAWRFQAQSLSSQTPVGTPIT